MVISNVDLWELIRKAEEAEVDLDFLREGIKLLATR